MDLKENTLINKRNLETLWARQLAYTHLSDDEYQVWLSFRSVDKIYLGIGDYLVNWQRIAGQNKIVKRFQLRDVASTGHAMTFFFAEEGADGRYAVSHVPQSFADSSVFAWVPHFNEVRHQPNDWDFAGVPAKLTFGVCVWQRSNPTKGLSEHHKYVTSEKHFQKHWASLSHTSGA